jgi:phosphohistidine phosphatase
MSLRLTLIRHAKSSWDGDEEDHARPLSKRGRRSADAIGRWLAGRMPEHVVCSDAVRTRETWARIADAGDGPGAKFLPELYHASCDVILQVLRRAEVGHLGLVGHNPGIALFATRIVTNRPEHPRFSDYPTGATTLMTFEADAWSEVAWGSGRVEDFIVPRDL